MKFAGGNHFNQICGKIGIETTELRQNLRIDANRCCRDVKQVRRLANEFTNILAMGTPVRKTLRTDAGRMQRRRHHMTARGLSLCSMYLKPDLNVATESTIQISYITVFHSNYGAILLSFRYMTIHGTDNGLMDDGQTRQPSHIIDP